ncbi:MAG: tRNA (adenosine(37)-N6)-dimethylallyltransferase MiaA [Clostridiales bacterium]|nr:tRNA (adenosine(37)-N6)-dimethylallyltransferase MiaA [Clostridiales bacterium]
MTGETKSPIPALGVVGPTASGKSALAMMLAQSLGGEILNMDSMQVYRRMDIGTAKPSRTDQALVRHHLLDIVEPYDNFSVAQYARLAEQAVQDVYARGALPVLTGGTGFYLRALTDGLRLGGVPSDAAVRERLKSEAAQAGGKRALFERLRKAYPAAAAKLHENDVLRVTRALEVLELTGKPISQQERPADAAPFRFCLLGTTLERETLYRRIEARVDGMLEQGLPDEVSALLASGVSPQAQAMQGIGYKELAPVMLCNAPLWEAVELMKRNTRRYAKRQGTWFRAVPGVVWLDMCRPESMMEALRIAGAFWKEAKA